MYVAIHRTCRRIALQEAARPRAPTVQRQHTDLVHFLIDLLVDMVAPILLELEVIGLGPPSQDLSGPCLALAAFSEAYSENLSQSGD